MNGDRTDIDVSIEPQKAELGSTYCLVNTIHTDRRSETINSLQVMTDRCPKPERTFSRFFTASMKAGTFSGLLMQALAPHRYSGFMRLPANRDKHPDDSFIGATYITQNE